MDVALASVICTGLLAVSAPITAALWRRNIENSNGGKQHTESFRELFRRMAGAETAIQVAATNYNHIEKALATMQKELAEIKSLLAERSRK